MCKLVKTLLLITVFIIGVLILKLIQNNRGSTTMKQEEVDNWKVNQFCSKPNLNKINMIEIRFIPYHIVTFANIEPKYFDKASWSMITLTYRNNKKEIQELCENLTQIKISSQVFSTLDTRWSITIHTKTKISITIYGNGNKEGIIGNFYIKYSKSIDDYITTLFSVKNLKSPEMRKQK